MSVMVDYHHYVDNGLQISIYQIYNQYTTVNMKFVHSKDVTKNNPTYDLFQHTRQRERNMFWAIFDDCCYRWYNWGSDIDAIWSRDEGLHFNHSKVILRQLYHRRVIHGFPSWSGANLTKPHWLPNRMLLLNMPSWLLVGAPEQY